MTAHRWGMTPEEIAEEHGLTDSQVSEALAFFEAHRDEIEALVAAEQRLEPADA
ncbi:MAG: hypothetical protein GY856_02130 [bacterium]|nr:hypothetical protein [bacterium]